jgi:HK97 family phage prohead protease
MPENRQIDLEDIDDDTLECIADLMQNFDVTDWDQAFRICTERKRHDPFEKRATKLEIRARGRRLEGYAAVFGSEAKIGDFTEVIAPGAFNRSLQQNDIVAMVDHDVAKVLARTRSRTLRLAEDAHGLAFDLDVPSTTSGNDVLALARRGDLGGMSFGFLAVEEDWTGNKRTLHEVDLREISVVQSWPAYPETKVVVRRKSQIHSFRLVHLRRYLETL